MYNVFFQNVTLFTVTPFSDRRMNIHDLPPEIIDDILFNTDPLEVAAISQCSRYFYTHIYHAPDRHLWRGLYLEQQLDDPEKCVSPLGNPRIGPFDWKGQLQLSSVLEPFSKTQNL
ncbi:hypothetical protein MPER_05637 [Moniliophthora perniciosa FA553]|nr:hypothetical protein MPER_05637 [Moniliophthora perniciosa FA553]